jgi:Icc-related predicted phosphoesterase
MAHSGPGTPRDTLRIAAIGDIHCREANRERIQATFSRVGDDADLVLLAGDLTSHGTVAEADVLCEAVALTSVPVFAVLGNHDWNSDKAEAIGGRLRESGVGLLEGEAAVCEVNGVEVGIVGSKGFVGGFAPRHLPDFGEPSLRALYAETTAEVEALDAGLHQVATCPIRIVLLHYSPLEATLKGEPPEILPFLGSDRLAAPILEHGPDLVLHGHAHEGEPEGRIGEVPVRNVAQPVVGPNFVIIELDVGDAHDPIP